MTFRARFVGCRGGVEVDRVDRVPEPAVTVDVALDELVGGDSVGDVRRVVSFVDR